MTDHSQDRVTVWMSSAMNERMDEYIDFKNGSRSQWVREAAAYRMILEDAIAREGIELPATHEDADERKRIIREILERGVDEYAAKDE